ncbi:MAG: thiamine pyrophosphate-dependent enzyme, partial [Nitriliruptoraceae bacterium]
LRRNVNLKILLFNNEIYGLTKGQYSPTSPLGSMHKSTPLGSLDRPINPVSLALGVEATYVARSIDTDRQHLTSVLRGAYEHRGSAFVEIYQNCNIFNDGAFAALKDKDKKDHNQIRLEAGKPITFGPEGERAVVAESDGSMSIVPTEEAGDRVVVHDPARDEPTTAFALSRLALNPVGPTPIGIFRDVDRPVYDELVREQVAQAKSDQGEGDLTALLSSGNVWDVL